MRNLPEVCDVRVFGTAREGEPVATTSAVPHREIPSCVAGALFGTLRGPEYRVGVSGLSSGSGSRSWRTFGGGLLVKKTSNWVRRGNGLYFLAWGAFVLTAIVFVYLLYYARVMGGMSSGLH
jgi:hypothetical protein